MFLKTNTGELFVISNVEQFIDDSVGSATEKDLVPDWFAPQCIHSHVLSYIKVHFVEFW